MTSRSGRVPLRLAMIAMAVMLAASGSGTAFAEAIHPIPKPEDHGVDPHSAPHIAGLPWWAAVIVVVSVLLAWSAYWRAFVRE